MTNPNPNDIVTLDMVVQTHVELGFNWHEVTGKMGNTAYAAFDRKFLKKYWKLYHEWENMQSLLLTKYCEVKEVDRKEVIDACFRHGAQLPRKSKEKSDETV